jgi:cell division protease FtsH
MNNNMLKAVTFWALLAVVLMMLLSGVKKASEPAAMNYSDFLTLASKGELTQAEVLMRENGQGYTVRGKKKDGSQFELMAPTNDQNLFSILRQGNIPLTVKPSETSLSTVLISALYTFGPILLLVLLWFFMLNRMQGGGPGGAMAFGKSKAKMLQGNQGKVTFADVAGVEEAKEELAEIIDFLKDPGKYQKLGGKIPKGVLLLGPPGTGKTLLARAVAGEAGRPFFSISGSDFVEMFVGVGASRVRDLFEQGKKNAPCIIFIDEIDAVGRHRGAGLGGGHDEREQTLNAMLVEMDGFEANTGVILMAATNRPDVLDPALIRPGRFDRQVVVDRPDLIGRDAILKVHVRHVVLGPDVNTEILARRTPGFSGADLANLVNEGALLAARRGKKAVGMSELEEAIDRVMAGPQRRSRVMSEKEKRVIAYHESGHALVAKLTPNTDPVHKISIIPRGFGVLGYVMQLPTEDRFIVQREEMLSRLAVSLGGRVAEEIIFGDISTGASNDLQKATETARSMVMRFGMSAKLGRVTYGSEEREVFLGRDFNNQANYSDKTAEAIDAEVRLLVESAHKQAKALLTKHKKKLETLAKALLEREVIEGEDLDSLLGLKPSKPKPAPAPLKKDDGNGGPTPTAGATIALKPPRGGMPAPSPA